MEFYLKDVNVVYYNIIIYFVSILMCNIERYSLRLLFFEWILKQFWYCKKNPFGMMRKQKYDDCFVREKKQ